jgi:site-specific DNA recombinase
MPSKSTSSSRVHVYCRVSSAGQEDGYSLDTQEAACRAWAKERSLPVASVAREVWSGGDRHRPELDALLGRLVPGDTVLAYDLDRLCRGGVVDIAIITDWIERAGASVAFVTQTFEATETGALLRSVKAYAAAIEREQISERTQRGKRARVASGKPLVGQKPPFGYRWADPDKTRLDLDADEAATVRRIYDLALGGMSLRGICAVMERDGIASPGGKTRWTATGVRHILVRPTYSGTAVAYRHRHERRPGGRYAVRAASEADMIAVPGIAPAIVSETEQATVAQRLSVNQANATRNNRMPERSLLRCGIARCGSCGRAMAVKNPYPSRPDGPPRYFCKHAECGRPSIATTVVDGPVWAAVSTVLREPEIIAREVARHRTDGGLDRDLAAIERQLPAIADKQGRTARAIAAVDDDDAAAPLLAELKNLADRKKALEAERDHAIERIADRAAENARLQTLTDWCALVGTNLDSLSYDEKRLALDALGVQVRVYRPNATDETGAPLPRWEVMIRPASPETDIVYRSTRQMRGA